MNSLQVKEYLLQHEDKLKGLLENIGLCHIHKNSKNEIRSARHEGGNPTTIRVKLNDNLSYDNFHDNKNGDIFKLVGDTLGFSEFRKNFKYICNYLNVDGTYEVIEKTNIFGGFFNNFSNKNNDLKCDIKIYPIESLNEYELCGNELFQRDGIDLSTQIKYNIGYDWNTHRITIPEFSFEGELVGVTGRYNGQDYEKKGEPKYYPIIEFPKSQVLFGYSQNYNDLLGTTIWLVESQKSVMRMDSLGKRNFLGLGGKALSPIQIKYIQNLNPKRVIVSLDSDATEEEAIILCEKLKPTTSFMFYKVGYIYDKEQEYLKPELKNSICDLETLQNIKNLSKKVKWV